MCCPLEAWTLQTSKGVFMECIFLVLHRHALADEQSQVAGASGSHCDPNMSKAIHSNCRVLLRVVHVGRTLQRPECLQNISPSTDRHQKRNQALSTSQRELQSGGTFSSSSSSSSSRVAGVTGESGGATTQDASSKMRLAGFNASASQVTTEHASG